MAGQKQTPRDRRRRGQNTILTSSISEIRIEDELKQWLEHKANQRRPRARITNLVHEILWRVYLEEKRANGQPVSGSIASPVAEPPAGQASLPAGG